MRAADLVTGLVLLAAGLMSVRRAPGWLLLAAGLAWFAGDVASWAVYLHRGPLVQLVVVYPFLRPRGAWAWVLTAAGYLCAVVPVLTASSAAAFANTARHAGATAAALGAWEQDGRLYLEITDDGVGGARAPG